MIKSMTGYGLVIHDDSQVKISVEIKSLNSKFLDLMLRLPKSFSDKEIDIRNLISEKLERGKVSISVDVQRYSEGEIKQSYNEALFTAYYAALKKLADKVMAPYEQLFELALNSPDVIQNKVSEEGNDEEWRKLRKVIEEAITKCDVFRRDEGNSLEVKLKEYCSSISSSLTEVERLDAGRVDKVRQKLKNNVVSFFGEEGFDMNRLEQEIIFYIEKLDIHEERVRLKTHLDYFIQVLKEPQSNGKKLGFITQEIGREINTIGSKANDAAMQKHVVAMKEELEKIKEQLGNVL
ncbi:MAG TPA: YicC family protein [Cyclobacteriaceae bacterium]|nr:YicC family protein [Cyclobacteriaceae bacterium]HRJ81235.1 YicC family protein [Cyclobacteriaceae bacterium]